MGDAADLVLEGGVCSLCGEVIDGHEAGYPVQCCNCDPSSPYRVLSWEEVPNDGS